MGKKSEKKQDKKQGSKKLEAPHFAAIKGQGAEHGAHDVQIPIVVNQKAGHHSGRPHPPVTRLGGDQLPSGEGGGGVGAGVEPAQPEQFLPKCLRED